MSSDEGETEVERGNTTNASNTAAIQDARFPSSPIHAFHSAPSDVPTISLPTDARLRQKAKAKRGTFV
eukprot:9924575-Lingulodinium_polyedra.AAC.1